MSLSTQHLNRCIETLEHSYAMLKQNPKGSIAYEVARNATIKGFELCLETAGKLVRKALKPYFATPRHVDHLVFKDIFRYAGKHGILPMESIERWFSYRDNRNDTAHDYGEEFAEKTVSLVREFLDDVKKLSESIDARTES